MNIIDLSQSLFDHMPVYPGDPDVLIQQIHLLKTEGWNLRTLALTTHIGTHVNAPIHMNKNGKTLDNISLEQFFGPCALYREKIIFNKHTGVIFSSKKY
jgi:arylformamidase